MYDAEMARDAVESIKRRSPLRLASENADEHLRVPKVARDVDPGDGHEANNARVLYAFGEEGRHFFANRFGDSVGATGIVRHDWYDPAPARVRALTLRVKSGAHAACCIGEPGREKENTLQRRTALAPYGVALPQLVDSDCSVRATSSVR